MPEKVTSNTAHPAKKSIAPSVAIILTIVFGIVAVGIVTAISTLTVSNVPRITHNTPLTHIIIIDQENHAFDNYFGTFPNATGPPSGTCIPYNLTNLSKGCQGPFVTNDPSVPGMAHGWVSSHTSYNNGSMNGFFQAETNQSKPLKWVMSEYNNQTIPYYWDYAEHYTLLNNLYSSVLSYSLPNHWDTIAGTAPKLSYFYGTGDVGPGPNSSNGTFYKKGHVTPRGYKYLNQSQPIKTLADVFKAGGISWRYYSAGGIGGTYKQNEKNGAVFSYWNPLLSQNRSYNANVASNIKPTGAIFTDIQNGKLANVSWVSPTLDLSEHPPANIIYGMWYVTDIVDSVMQSKYWNSTAIIFMEDDYGGYYDNAPPPQLDSYGLSFRVPGIVISPYAKENYIDRTNYSFESTMKLIEYVYGLSNLTARDGSGRIGNLLNSFNFSQKPQKPYIIPLNQTQLDIVNRYLSENTVIGANDEGNITVNGYTLPANDFDT